MHVHCQRKFKLCFFFVFVCMVAVPLLFSWISSLCTRQQAQLDVGGKRFPVMFKKVVLNKDGTMDMVLNIPDSVKVLTTFQQPQSGARYNVTARNQFSTPQRAPAKSHKTLYPVTMESPYVINSPGLCRDVRPLHVLVIVHTATEHFQRRRFIRETWASKNLMKTRNLRLLFLLGLTSKIKIQKMIENEHIVYGDVVQGQFLDTYRNLTNKGVLAYRWIHEHCPHVQLILKVDDDVFINPFNFYETYFPMFSKANRTIACHSPAKNTSPIWRKKGKWQIQEYEFRGYTHYPFTHCHGYLVIITPDIVKSMFLAAYTTPFFWVDDVYLYGILPFKIGRVTHINLYKNLTINMSLGMNCYRKREPPCKLLAMIAPKQEVRQEAWQLSLTNMSPSIKSQINPVYLIT